MSRWEATSVETMVLVGERPIWNGLAVARRLPPFVQFKSCRTEILLARDQLVMLSHHPAYEQLFPRRTAATLTIHDFFQNS